MAAIICFRFYVGVKQCVTLQQDYWVSVNNTARLLAVCEQSAEENIWTEEGTSNRRLEKSA
jgi:hypothetical protein